MNRNRLWNKLYYVPSNKIIEINVYIIKTVNLLYQNGSLFYMKEHNAYFRYVFTAVRLIFKRGIYWFEWKKGNVYSSFRRLYLRLMFCFDKNFEI